MTHFIKLDGLDLEGAAENFAIDFELPNNLSREDMAKILINHLDGYFEELMTEVLDEPKKYLPYAFAKKIEDEMIRKCAQTDLYEAA